MQVGRASTMPAIIVSRSSTGRPLSWREAIRFRCLGGGIIVKGSDSVTHLLKQAFKGLY